MPITLIVGGLIAAIIGIYAFTQSKSTDIDVEPATRTEDTTTPTNAAQAETISSDTSTEMADGVVMAGLYKNGIYRAEASYLTPRRTEHVVNLELTIENDVVTSSVVTFDGKPAGESSNDNQAQFAEIHTSKVIGVKLDDVLLARVGGASLTSNAYNEARAKIAADAAAS